MIKLKNLIKTYKSSENNISVINGLSLNIKQGEFVSIMGPSGSGKSTLLNIISTLDDATSGDVIIDKMNIATIGEEQKADIRKDKLSFVFQDYNLVSSLTVYENAFLPMLIKKEKDEDYVNEILNRLDISHIKDKYPYEISGGQRQRCSCARALVSKNPILLADEPTGALDSSNRKELMNVFLELNKVYKMTIVMVTHDVMSACFSNKVFFIKDGNIESVMEKESTNRDFYKKLMHRLEDLEEV